MKKILLVIAMSLYTLTLLSACNSSDNERTFSSFSNDAFTATADSEPKRVDNVDFIYDNDTDETAYDTAITNGEFAS